MEDYLDHLGRMYILTTAGTNDANPYYQVSWGLYSDLAMDIVVPLLTPIRNANASANKVLLIT